MSPLLVVLALLAATSNNLFCDGALYAKKDKTVNATVIEISIPEESLDSHLRRHEPEEENRNTDSSLLNNEEQVHEPPQQSFEDLVKTASEDNKGSNHRSRRSADSDPHTGHPYHTSTSLHDNHTNAFISWAGTTPKIVVLTRSSTSSHKLANIYVSNNYGQNFTVIPRSQLKATLPNGTLVDSNPGFLYHAGGTLTTDRAMTSYLFVDQTNNVIISTHDLVTFNTSHVGFTPYQLTFSATREDIVLCLGVPEGLTATSNLYVSTDFGMTWSVMKSRVTDYSWGWHPDQVFASVSTFFGSLFDNFDVVEMTYDGTLQQRTMISRVDAFQIKGYFLFAVKSRSLTSDGNLELHVSKNGSAFQTAQFPVITNVTNKEYFIVDADHDRVMVCVNHDVKSSHLYVSDTSGTRYTLSLPNIVYISPQSVRGTNLPGIRFYVEPFVDMHKVEGLRSIYIASQFITNKTSDLQLADTNQTTRITYDKGGLWTHIRAPYITGQGSFTHCYWYVGCTLHLLQDFLFGASYRSAPILSSENAIGLVIGSGVLGFTLKQEKTPSVFISRDAGFNWHEAFKGNFTYNFGDHGNIIVMIEPRKRTRSLLYSHDEGQSWSNFTFSSEDLTVYGLLTEPGSKSGNFSIWGSKSDGAHSWEVVHLNMLTIFNGTLCDYGRDYKMWSPGVNVSSKEICLLGEQEVVERKIADHFCLNGRSYERWSYNHTCKCVRSDFECAYGYMPANESESLWDPHPTFQIQETMTDCIRDPDVSGISVGKPDFCPYGTTYNVSIGYRRIPGDVCEGGMNHLYGMEVRDCPPDNKTDFLVYATGTNIYRFDVDTQRSEFIVRGSTVSEIYSVEFDYNRDILFWADQDSDAVMYYNMSHTNPTPQILVSGDTGKIECIALDWESDNIYLVDSRGPKIEIFSTMTRWRRTIVKNNNTNPTVLEKPRALDVVPEHGIMFWTDWSETDPRVMRSTMSGFNITTLINGSNHNLVWPNGLAADIDNELVYVIDGNTHQLVVVKFDGSGYKVILTDPVKIRHPFALTLTHGRLFWSDWEDNKVKSVIAKTGQGFYTPLQGFSNRVMALQALNWDIQYKAGKTGCGHQTTSKDGCSNICVPQGHPNQTASQNRVCLCPEYSAPQNYTTGSSERDCLCGSGSTFNHSTGYCELSHGSTCGPNLWKCSNSSRCISESWRCDHDNDCGDLSDETNCASVLCSDNEFLCAATQRCISKSWICDGDNDCGDMSDEAKCNNITCRTDQFQCNNHNCIPIGYKCDGEEDCGIGDPSDEQNCSSSNSTGTCDSLHHSCVSTQFSLTCIPNAWLCDGETDCDDSSDEQNCGLSTCSTGQFPCSQSNNSRCIPHIWQCDGYADCTNGEDEVDCNTTTTGPTTTPSSPVCLCNNTYGQCVSFDAQCDGVYDCPYGWDEYNCYNQTSTTSSWYTTTPRQCIGYPCSNGYTCITADKICDGRNDCHPLHEDEHNCNCDAPGSVPCALNRKQCISASKVCDGHNDCFNGTDEQGCASTGPTTHSPCTGRFKCKKSGLCINFDLFCDGVYHCFDGSDEENCDETITITRLRVANITATSAYFSWNTSTPTAAKNISYHIQYLYVSDVHTHTNSTGWIHGTVIQNRHSGVVEGLTPYSNYRFRVRAFVKQGGTEKQSTPSEELHLATREAPPGPVGTLRAYLQDYVGRWGITFKPPSHPNGKIIKYRYAVFVNKSPIPKIQGESSDVSVDAVTGKVDIPLTVDLDARDIYSSMQVKVWAVNGAGEGTPVNTTHCFSLMSPTITCVSKSDSRIDTTINLSQFEMAGYTYSLHIAYYDVDNVEKNVVIPVNSSADQHITHTFDNLSPGLRYTFTTEFERNGATNQLDCSSAAMHTTCSTSGTLPNNVQGVQLGNATTTGFTVSWTKAALATKYQMVVASNMEDLHAGRYENRFESTTNTATATGLASCQSYFVAVKVIEPITGKLSSVQQVSTKFDMNAAPHQLQIDDGPPGSLDNLLWALPDGDPIPVNISWTPACHKENVTYIVYLREYSPGWINDTTVHGVNGRNYNKFMLQRGGSYELTVQNGRKDGKNSTAKNFSPDPYPPPSFSLTQLNDDTADIQYSLDEFTNIPDEYLSQFKGKLDIQYKEGNGKYMSVGVVSFMLKGSCKIPAVKLSANYTVQIRYARQYKNRYYFGEYGTKTFTSTVNSAAAAAHSGKNPNGSKIGMWVGIGVSLTVVLVLTTLLGVWCVRHRRLQRSFMEFTSSRYNSRTDNATFSGDGDDDDSPMIQGFSDDEPLVIA